MNPRERGFLLLTSRLGNPDRQVLSTAQLRMLALRMRGRECAQPEREMTRQDFIELGYDRETAERYCALLSDTQELDYYLSRGRKMDCTPVTRVSEEYPGILRQRLGMDAPGCLWAKGELSILNTPAVALVGSRELRAENREFAAAVGYRAAEEGLTLLILDDFGMERGTEYGLEQVYSVIDSRYRSRRPLIVTTNLTLQQIQNPTDTAYARIYDRLLEMCAPVRFTGGNFRRETAQAKLERLKNLMNE